MLTCEECPIADRYYKRYDKTQSKVKIPYIVLGEQKDFHAKRHTELLDEVTTLRRSFGVMSVICVVLVGLLIWSVGVIW